MTVILFLLQEFYSCDRNFTTVLTFLRGFRARFPVISCLFPVDNVYASMGEKTNLLGVTMGVNMDVNISLNLGVNMVVNLDVNM